MKFLEKRNPKATARSVIVSAVGRSFFGLVFVLAIWLIQSLPDDFLYFMIPWMVIVGAATGAELNWRVPDNDDTSGESDAPCKIPN